MIYSFNAFLFRIPADFFVKIDKLILKSMRKCRELRITKTVLEKNKVGGLTLPNFETYYKATVIKTVWYQHKDGHMDQWDRIENPELKPCGSGHLSPNKGTKIIQGGKNGLFHKWCWGNWISTCKRTKFDT